MSETIRGPELRLGTILGAPPERTTPQGLAPRGLYPPGEGVAHDFQVLDRSLVWAEGVEELYEQARARQWDAGRDIPWARGRGVPEPVERALCAVLTWMVQQEFAAWYVPAKFVPRIHPAYLEPVLFLSTQVADEARHVEVFTKRLFLNGMGFVGAYPNTEASLRGLLAQDEFDKASFLLHVLGEGTFLDLFAFLRRIAPEEASRTIFTRSHEDEARHVAYGTGRVRIQLRQDPRAIDRFVGALEERLSFARDISGIPPEIQESLAVLAGGGEAGASFLRGVSLVREFQRDLAENCLRRLEASGVSPAAAAHISELHRRASGNGM
ncbi:MAG: ferritin-like domain-containing protein [Armatimonadota bacterium]|nr:ferritin-like domain-containing protein [Armatimonadota bacterium]MDR7452774.1 ferritin-like domain-containing protein [Armatimonadota bacterium]MDR7468329.1 ferritin-like domain-containing protein [Armatimonadota bacterium]MDR7495278.1 ferritin-like domain-containing protein [Armatimonadota bacterium]MDR7500520.1 ferritin-like domain-containing protein [Armatimonadota bacterium]